MDKLNIVSLPGHQTKKRQFNNYLLDRQLQLRYVAVVLVISAVVSSALGFLIWRQEARASVTLMTQTAASDGMFDEDAISDIRGDLARQDAHLVIKMVAVGLALVVVLSLYLLFLTHKVAGPLHRVSRYFDQMRDGHLGDTGKLRKSDLLRDFYESFREMHTAVRARHREDIDRIGRFLRLCNDAGVQREGDLGHTLDELERYTSRRELALTDRQGKAS